MAEPGDLPVAGQFQRYENRESLALRRALSSVQTVGKDMLGRERKWKFSVRSCDRFGPVLYGVNQRKRLFSEEKMVGDVGIEPTTR